jgi:hypothetical protein
MILKIKCSKELSLNDQISFLFHFGLRLFFYLCLDVFILSFLFPGLHQLFSLHQFLSTLLSYFSPILYLLLLNLFFNFLFVILFSSPLGTEHSLQVFMPFIFVESDSSRNLLLFMLKIVSLILILTHLQL